MWTTVATGGAAIGLLLGGALTQFISWEWNFFINVPVGIALTYAILKYIPKIEKEETQKSLDLPGAALVTSGLILFVFGISQSAVWGIESWKTISTMLFAIMLLVAFVYNESKAKHPLMPLSIFKIRNVVGANLMMAPVAAGMFGMFYLMSLYIQSILHFDPVTTGLSFLPFPIILGFMSTRIASLVSKYGFKRFLVIGPVFVALGLAWVSRLPVHGTYLFDLLPTIILMPIGMGMTFMPIIAAATSGVPSKESGLASGLITTSQQMGGALGLAILSGVATAVTGTSTVPFDLVQGYDRAFLVAVCFIIIATILGFFIIRERERKQSFDNLVLGE